MPAKKQISQEEINKIITEYITGKSIRELEKIFGYSFNCINRILKENNVQLRDKKDIYALRQEKSKETCLKKYGVDNPAKAEEIKQKISLTESNTMSLLYEERRKEIAEKISKSLSGRTAWNKGIKTGKLTEEENQKRLKKQYETKKRNNSFNTSSPEEKYYLTLCEIYGADDIIRQYSDERYPFCCDFYIKSKDLFIELNISWTHGGRSFDINDQECLNKLLNWQERAEKSDYYKNAIETWTVRDVIKSETAIKNHLNYLVYYSEDELYN